MNIDIVTSHARLHFNWKLYITPVIKKQEMFLCSPTMKGNSKVQWIAGQVSKVVASEQGCGEHKVVGAYPNCTWCIPPLHMYGGVWQ